MAALLFKKKLAGPSGNILYIVSDKEQLALLPENCLRRQPPCWNAGPASSTASRTHCTSTRTFNPLMKPVR